jgi:hypothetical protein
MHHRRKSIEMFAKGFIGCLSAYDLTRISRNAWSQKRDTRLDLLPFKTEFRDKPARSARRGPIVFAPARLSVFL